MGFQMHSGKAIGEINVTPLVDVMLVLLIIFMVTTAASEQKKLERQTQDPLEEKISLVHLNLPITPDNPLLADPDTAKLVMIVDSHMRIFLTKGLSGKVGEHAIADCEKWRKVQKISDWASCFDMVQQALGGSPKTPNHRMIQYGVYLEADRSVPYGFIAGIMGRLRYLGVDQIDIVTHPRPKD